MAFEEATSTITALKEDALSAKSQLSAEADDLRNANNKTKLEERERQRSFVCARKKISASNLIVAACTRKMQISRTILQGGLRI
jgi:hypothetical protein